MENLIIKNDPFHTKQFLGWENNEEIQLFREYLRIPSVHPKINYRRLFLCIIKITRSSHVLVAIFTNQHFSFKKCVPQFSQNMNFNFLGFKNREQLVEFMYLILNKLFFVDAFHRHQNKY